VAVDLGCSVDLVMGDPDRLPGKPTVSTGPVTNVPQTPAMSPFVMKK